MRTLNEIVRNESVTMISVEDRGASFGGACRMKGIYGDIFMIFSNAEGWDHVSISTKYGTPSWADMCKAKDIFFEDEENVIQYHPPKSEYINIHPNVLHMWRSQNFDVPRPPLYMI